MSPSRRDPAGARIGTGVAVALVVLLCAGAVAHHLRRRFDAGIARRVEALLAAVDPGADRRVTEDDLAGVPAPIRRYAEHVLPADRRYVRTARLRQRGDLRLGGPDASWRPFVATQHVTTRPPGFVWDATVDVLPRLPVRVLDAYARGEGRLRARLLGVLPVARAGPSPEMTEGELLRYLAEAVWYPTALLAASGPGGVEWEAIDDRSARATLDHRGTTASVVFHVDDRDEVERVTATRYRAETDREEPWTGRFRAYRDRDGIRVPTAAEVGWDRDGGSYWRATVEGVEYGTARAERPVGSDGTDAKGERADGEPGMTDREPGMTDREPGMTDREPGMTDGESAGTDGP